MRTLTRGTTVAAGIMTLPAALSESFTEKAHGTEVVRTYPRQRIAALRDLQPGEPISFKYPDDQHDNMLVQIGSRAQDGIGPDGDIVAYSVICPHMGCNIAAQYTAGRPAMLGPCPCHFSCFDISKSGMQTQGVATQDLPQVLLEMDGEEVFAIGLRGLLYGHAQNPY